MIHFVFVSGEPASVRSYTARLAPAIEHTRYFVGEPFLEVGPGGTWAVAGIEAADPSSARRVVVRNDAVGVLCGAALASDGDQPGLADRMLERFVSGGPAGAASALAGCYAVVGASSAQGMAAFGDLSGMCALSWARGPGVAVVSNRSTTVAATMGIKGWDPEALGWLVGHANLVGDRMPAGVDYLVPGSQLRQRWGEATVAVERSPSWLWPGPSHETRDDLEPEEWDAVTDALTSTCRSFSQFDRSLRLGLTGGKDSRLCLAIAKAAGLRSELAVVTDGPHDSPEVEVAAHVARAAGYEHRRNGPPPPDTTSDDGPEPRLDAVLAWRQLRQHVYRREATVCPWDGLTGHIRGTILSIKGFGGELYRGPGGHAKQFSQLPVTVEAMAERFIDYHQPHDPLGVLLPGHRLFQRDWLSRWVHATAEAVRFDLIPLKFYVDYRLGHWNSPLNQFTPGRLNLNPLVSPAAAQASFGLSGSAASEERLHYEVMRRTAPELLTVPLLRDTWKEPTAELAARHGIDLPREPYATTHKPTSRRMRPWQWRFLADQGEAIGNLFADARTDGAMDQVCDLTALEEIGRSSADIRRPVEAKALMSDIAMALALLGSTEPVCDEPLEPARG